MAIPPTTAPQYPNLGRYLADLVQNPDKLRALKASPNQEMAKANLTNDEKNVLYRGNKDEMAAVLTQHDPTLAQSVITIVCL